ncbi:MAG: ATP-binding protein [Candidatus Dormibacteria bacterium]
MRASTEAMRISTGATSELRIPADPQYIVVAKRVAAGMASVAGLGVEALDELNIAIAEACEHTIRAALAAGLEDAKVRLSFAIQEDALRVEVRPVGGRSESRPAPAAQNSPEALDLAISMLRCFADDVDFRSAGGGLMRVRLAKYRWR